MKKLLVATVFFAFITPVYASEYSEGTHTVTESHTEFSDASDQSWKGPNRCNPATENWVNAAHITCPVQGSGPNGHSVTITITREVPNCEHEYKSQETAAE